MGGNPISRADPDGDFWHIVAGAVIGAGVNVFMHWDDITAGGKVNWGEFGKAAGIGAAAGAVGAATGGAALGAAGLSATSVAGGALAGGVGAATSSPILGVGNNIAFGDPYSIKQWGVDVVGGIAIGGVAGGVGNLIKGKVTGVKTNFWTDADIAPGRTRWSLANTPKASGSVIIGPNGRVVVANSVAELANNQGLQTAQRGALDQAKIQSLLTDMDPGTFDATKYAVRGYRDGARTIIVDGNHRVTAALFHGMKTGDYQIANQLISAGNFRPAPSGMNSYSWISKWK